MWEWGNCLKYLKEGRGRKDLKSGGKLAQVVGALKRGWTGTHLWTMGSKEKNKVYFFKAFW